MSSDVLFQSIIYQTNAMESNTAWIRLFYNVFVMVFLTTRTGQGFALSYSICIQWLRSPLIKPALQLF